MSPALASGETMIAESRGQGIKVFAETKAGDWCRSDLVLRVEVPGGGGLSGSRAQALMQRLATGPLGKECPAAGERPPDRNRRSGRAVTCRACR